MTADFLENILRPDLRGLAAYSSARSEGAGAVSIAIDANESPWPPLGVFAGACQANRYPEGQPEDLRARLAALYGVTAAQILMGRGSDEAIDLLLRLTCRAGVDQVIVCPPTFGMYEVYARIQGAEVVAVPLDQTAGWALDVPRVLAACTERTKLIFIPSPNAPMGHLMARESLRDLCRARAGQSLIVVDEAYVEFTDHPEGVIADLADYPNLVVLRTLSKAFALAGERLGCALAHPDLIAALRKVQAPYPLPQSVVRVVTEALSPNGLIAQRARIKILVAERERMARFLPQSPFVKQVFSSVGNFLLILTTDSSLVMDRLASYGIRARRRDADIKNAVRLSVGSPEENNAVLAALDVVVPCAELGCSPRLFSVIRATKETKIEVTVDLDKPSFCEVRTGIGFFDHMMAQIAQHGGFGLACVCEGDLHIDQHHSIEDCALALGEALKGALGDKRGIGRYGFTTPLDEALADVAIDLSGRPYAVFEGVFQVDTIGEMDVEMVPHFFRSLASTLGAAIHVHVKGGNAHHMVEACFKALGRALRQALRREADEVCGAGGVPSTKGVL